MKRIKTEHQKLEIQILQTMLNAVGFHLDYQTTDLIHRTLKLKSSKATLLDCAEIKKKWQKDYENKELYTEI